MVRSSPVSRRWGGYVAAALGVAAMTGLIHLVPGATHIANISMLYLLVVIGLALRFGSAPAIFASVLAFLAFDWFFVQPYYTFTVSDPAEWLALMMFLITASITGQLTALLRGRADEARRRERETAALAEASWAVASQLDRDRALGEVLRQIAAVLPVRAAAILTGGQVPTEGGCGEPELVARWPADPGVSWGDHPSSSLATPPATRVPGSSLVTRHLSLSAVHFVLAEGRPVGWGEDRHHWDKALQDEDSEAPGAGAAYLPLITEHRVLGLLYLQLPDKHAVSPAERRVIESLAHHAAVVLERDRLARMESRANALAEADRLKTALLAMVSHDFRSPLASIKASVTGLLQEGKPWEPATQRELLQGMDHETDRLNRMIGSILALSRLEADAWRPQCEATPPAELVGAALDAFGVEENRRIQVALDPALIELWLDPAQMVQVLDNLLENALKYSPPGSPVELRLCLRQGAALLQVLDRGPGLPKGEEERIFEPFYRAPDLRESSVPGMGMGLAVCRGLVEAHGGQLTARNRDGGGALFEIRLPVGLDAVDVEKPIGPQRHEDMKTQSAGGTGET